MGGKTHLRRLLGLPPRKQPFRASYAADNFGVRNKNLDFMNDPDFIRGWAKSVEGNQAGPAAGKDLRWRAHTALWAARHGLTLQGDFVECGVFLGAFSLTICHALDFSKVPKQFYLFDTFEGIPDDGDARTRDRNASLYFDCYEQARQNFAPFPNCRLVRGVLPGTLATAPIERIAYLSVDLNHAAAESSVIRELWDRLAPSAVTLIDDYAFAGHEDQYEMWNEFAASKGTSILTMPTGQGVLIKT